MVKVAAFALVTVMHISYPALSAQTNTSRPEMNCEVAAPEIFSHYLRDKSQWPCADQLPGDLEMLPPQSQEDPALVLLGQVLFNDPNLSRDGTISCASCHVPEERFSDAKRISPGVEQREGRRTTPTLMNVDLWETLFWDSRTSDLVLLAQEPLTNPVEMDSSTDIAVQGVQKGEHYPRYFTAAFGSSEITWERIAQSLAAFQRTLRSAPNRYENFLHAIEQHNFELAETLISEQEIRGLHLFRTRARCVRCHHGPLLSDGKQHNMGLHYFGRKYEDLGVYDVSDIPEDVGKFRTPTLRHLTETAPWMHNGLFSNLLGIIRMYEHGGARPTPRGEHVNNPLYPTTTDELIPFELTTEEEQALLSFLQML